MWRVLTLISRKTLTFVAIGIGIILLPTASDATSIGACQTDLPGLCTSEVTLSGTSLTMTLTNTSPLANGGYITAVAFNLEGAASITAFSSTNANFSLLPGLLSTGGSFSTSPYPNHEFVITISPSATQPWLGGGSPNGGLATGASATFTLTLGGTYGAVTEANVLGSEAIRFKGFTNGSSDKDLVVASVPEPATLFLLGSGLAGVGLLRRKRRSGAQA